MIGKNRVNNIKGIILAGGLGKRLGHLTKITNKHLLPVYTHPMIYYPIHSLVDAGIKDIMIVTGGNHADEFARLLGDGEEFGLKKIEYVYQKGEGGIADALSLCEKFVADSRVAVVLGDNILEKPITPYVEKFKKQEKGGRLLLKEVADPERFGVATVEGTKITGIIEKPKKTVSPYAVTGIYMYDARVFDMVKTLKPSGRGELEITDVNNIYIKDNQMEFDILDGWWTDAGTHESLLRANNLIAEKICHCEER